LTDAYEKADAVLASMESLLSERSRWSKFCMAEDEHGYSTSPRSNAAVRFCLWGALEHVEWASRGEYERNMSTIASRFSLDEEVCLAAVAVYRSIMRRTPPHTLLDDLSVAGWVYQDSVTAWNDAYRRQHSSVVNAIKRARQILARERKKAMREGALR
jgi:hypothetical protein